MYLTTLHCLTQMFCMWEHEHFFGFLFFVQMSVRNRYTKVCSLFESKIFYWKGKKTNAIGILRGKKRNKYLRMFGDFVNSVSVSNVSSALYQCTTFDLIIRSKHCVNMEYSCTTFGTKNTMRLNSQRCIQVTITYIRRRQELLVTFHITRKEFLRPCITLLRFA